MRKHIVVFMMLSVFHLCALATPLTANTVNLVGDDDFPPFSYKDDDGTLHGIDIAILNELQKRLDITFSIDLVPWKRLLLMTEQGKVFGSFSLFDTPERREYALFTHPVHYSTYKFITRKDRPIEFENIFKLNNKRIGIQAGFSIHPLLKSAHQEGRIELVELYTYEDLFRRLHGGALDAVVGNELVVSHKLRHEFKEFSKDLIIGNAVVESRGAYLVLSKNSKVEDINGWQARITKTLKDMEQDGFVQSVIDTYLNTP